MNIQFACHWLHFQDVVIPYIFQLIGNTDILLTVFTATLDIDSITTAFRDMHYHSYCFQ